MMILSAEYSHSPHSQHQAKMAASMLHSPHSAHSLYAGYLSMDPSWHHPAAPQPQHLKQEPEESCNNDSGISPSPYHSDGSVQNTSPQSQSGRSEDSGHGHEQTNATLGVLARPIMASSSPRQSPLSRLSPLQRQLSPLQMSPREETQTNASLGVLARPVMGSPRQSPLSRLSPLQPAMQPSPQSHSSPQRQSPAQLVDKPADENSRSSVSSAEMELYYDNPLKGLQMALQRRGMMEPLPGHILAPPEQPVNGEKPLQCPLCQYSTTIRSAFNNHLMREHGEQVSCHLCDFTAENHIRLKEHLRVEHDTTLAPEDETAWMDEDEAGVTTPKVNSQGKVKTYRCKQCEFSTVTKLDFWEHTRSHIKPERLLTCPKCPFVTEYKHHLEYHLRNHFGSKPFKCDKCSYSCVNKSMLNSHLKSHSNVYQFRCADCAYATKYCHSLKLHLRKYGHNPAMVLNPDGSPNPLPIVDVYGTRRGPKRQKKPEELVSTQPSSLQGMQSIFPPYGFLPSQAMSYPYGALLGNFPRSPLLPFSTPPPIMQDETTHSKSENNLFNATINTIQQSAINNNQEGVKEYLTRVITTQQEIISRTLENEEEQLNVPAGAPLDLSRQEPDHPEQVSEIYNDQTPDHSATIKNRRKGKAFKLERIAQRLQHQSSDEEDCQPSPKQLRFDLSPEPKESVERRSPARDKSPGPTSPPAKVDFHNATEEQFKSTISEERKNRWQNVKEVYDCAYCDMLFGDLVMYTMHMGYHGYQNPYTCNMCGHKSSDRVQFFLHLFRVAHN